VVLKEVSKQAIDRALRQAVNAVDALREAQACMKRSSAADAGDWHAEFAGECMQRGLRHLKEN
jgi:hypothetical protein